MTQTLLSTNQKPSNKLLTLCFLIENGHVLLGYKKRGFGAGRWNGFGGKVDVAHGETIEQGAIREMKEEAGIDVTSLQNRGKIIFEFVANPVLLEVHVFVATSHTGDPQESEEMRPAWFALNLVPFDAMWVDDQHWLPQVLAGKSVDGYFLFDGEQTIKDQKVKFF